MMHHVTSERKPLPHLACVAATLAQPHRVLVARVQGFTVERRKEIGRRIAQAREGSGWTNITKFAAAIGSDRNSVGRWERGESVPEAHNLEAIGRITRHSVDWLLRGEVTPEWTALIDAWRRDTPRATDAVVGWIRGLPLAGYVPSRRFLDLALTAHEHGLTPEQAVTMAQENVTAADLIR